MLGRCPAVVLFNLERKWPRLPGESMGCGSIRSQPPPPTCPSLAQQPGCRHRPGQRRPLPRDFFFLLGRVKATLSSLSQLFLELPAARSVGQRIRLRLRRGRGCDHRPTQLEQPWGTNLPLLSPPHPLPMAPLGSCVAGSQHLGDRWPQKAINRCRCGSPAPLQGSRGAVHASNRCVAGLHAAGPRSGCPRSHTPPRPHQPRTLGLVPVHPKSLCAILRVSLLPDQCPEFHTRDPARL